MKYKLHEITSDCIFPTSREIYIPNVNSLLITAANLCALYPDKYVKEAIEVWTYNDSAFFEEPSEICFLSDFTIKL